MSNLYSILSNYSDIPVYLRIGAEFNVWSDKCTPDEYIPAFRAISDKMRTLQNVSIVWSIAHTSSWKTNDWHLYGDDFYPGDEYVDWVGVNCLYK